MYKTAQPQLPGSSAGLCQTSQQPVTSAASDGTGRAGELARGGDRQRPDGQRHAGLAGHPQPAGRSGLPDNHRLEDPPEAQADRKGRALLGAQVRRGRQPAQRGQAPNHSLTVAAPS